MFLVSLPHDKMVDLNRKYPVYDSEDGVIELTYATDILFYRNKYEDAFPNIQQTKYGGMLRRPFTIPNGTYRVGDVCTVTVKDSKWGYNSTEIQCEFIGLLGKHIVAVRDNQIKILSTLE